MFKQLCLLASTAVLVAGIVRAEKPDPTPAAVSGKVNLDGKPLAGATVTFNPVDKGGKAAIGKTDEEGNYVLKTGTTAGALPGKYRVTISVKLATRERIPAQYSDPDKTALTVEVTAKDNQLNFELASK
jgi:hypothetical protein